MNEIGEALKYARESSGVSLNEASKDLDIKPEILENIEDGRTGAFKDIYELKDYIASYAKYLGLDENQWLEIDLNSKLIITKYKILDLKEIY